ncbi:phosphoadenylyl-sulfate reductase [Ferrimicrobium acidiphilum]|uniref:Adenosine 5'-phosphosulfate reductase n=1 Tax=Ferrimicrobium acidiphilum DSM 19497 TaxID=1121877 RepID=A0A0D8FRJ4_9ACTN|nr:phosphoadenylyl-sulfate reductase [Ferrimicrobium acidiphilum]KJE75589.1 phosphoadenosine phosphosulfate reductase [Ferrimicrobium acidiphilum DSM 19497]
MADLNASIAVIEEAIGSYPDLAVTTGLNISGSVLLDLVSRSNFSGAVLFVDTGYHFPQTLSLWEELQDRYSEMNFVALGADNPPDTLYSRDPELCCSLNKVAPLENYLQEHRVSAVLNARTRVSSPGRRDLSVIEHGTRVRINPLIEWSYEDLEHYLEDRDIPYHSLYHEGYLSMGCWPCTGPVKPGQDPRSGRFMGQGRSECGIWLDVKKA